MLSAAPERTVTIPILKTELGATSADYGITPGLSLTFASDETEQTLTFTAASDDLDDDGESVKLAIGSLDGVTRGDEQRGHGHHRGRPGRRARGHGQLRAEFVHGRRGRRRWMSRSGSTSTPNATVEIPIVRTHERNASDADYVLPALGG